MERLKQAIKKVNYAMGRERFKFYSFAGKSEVMDLKKCSSAQANTKKEIENIILFFEIIA